jgi:hypothetical protein
LASSPRTNTALLVASFVAASAIFAIIFLFVFQENASGQPSPQSQQASHTKGNSSSPQKGAKFCIDCDRPSTNPGIFLAQGGKSVVTVKADNQDISLTRGSTARVVLTLSHMPGQNPLPFVNIVDAKINNGYIPAYLANQTTPEQRVEALQAGKPIPGAIDLNSLVTFESKPTVAIKPNESKQIFMDIAIPKDWDDRMVGENILFSIGVIQGPGYDYHDLLIKQTAVSVHIAG